LFGSPKNFEEPNNSLLGPEKLNLKKANFHYDCAGIIQFLEQSIANSPSQLQRSSVSTKFIGARKQY